MTAGLHIYEIRIRGVASNLVRVAFDDLTMSDQPAQTILRTGWVDSTELVSLIGRVETMGLVLLEAKAVEDVGLTGIPVGGEQA